jgi:hypothetical protein
MELRRIPSNEPPRPSVMRSMRQIRSGAYPFVPFNLRLSSENQRSTFNVMRTHVDRGAVDLVHRPMNLFHKFCFRKIILELEIRWSFAIWPSIF